MSSNDKSQSSETSQKTQNDSEPPVTPIAYELGLDNWDEFEDFPANFDSDNEKGTSGNAQSYWDDEWEDINYESDDFFEVIRAEWLRNYN